ncbi:MAG: hypothetical protein GY699_01285 [Desulfobacteraceae bacterium]|nr:hypothetical protein [Desulfobacteraceae bacterium]
MAESKVGTIQGNVEISNSYFALKSQDEIYYQMASIFKEAANDENDLAKKIFSGVLTGNTSEISLENF